MSVSVVFRTRAIVQISGAPLTRMVQNAEKAAGIKGYNTRPISTVQLTRRAARRAFLTRHVLKRVESASPEIQEVVGEILLRAVMANVVTLDFVRVVFRIPKNRVGMRPASPMTTL